VKVLAAYRAAVAAVDIVRQPADVTEVFDRQFEEVLPSAEFPIARTPQPPVSAGRKINEYSQDDLRAVVRWIMSDTLLRTHDQLLRETMKTLGFVRKGDRIVDAISRSIVLEQESLRVLREASGMW
jgi:hypothetical protein